MPSSFFPSLSNVLVRLHRNHVTAVVAALLLGVATAGAQTPGGAISISGANASGSSTVSVSGATGSVKTVKVTLNGVTSNGYGGSDGADGDSVYFTSFVLESPGGTKLVLLGDTGDSTDGDDKGDSGSGLDGVTIIVEDGQSAAPNGAPWPHTGSRMVAPSSYWLLPNESGASFTALPSDIDGDKLPQLDGTSPDGPDSGDATLNGTYASGAADGTWTLYILTDDPNGDTDPVSITGWTLALTYNTTSADSTSTTVISNTANPASTSSSIKYTATVLDTTHTGTTVDNGTVAFTANGSTILGCGSVAVNSGSASCTTTLATQGLYDIQAAYTPGTGFESSTSPNIDQLVEAPTSGSTTTDLWCNAGSIAIPGQSIGVVYPSVIKVSGYNSGTTVANIKVELNNVKGVVAAQHMLVAPSGSYNLDFFDASFNEADSISSGIDLNFYDSAGQYPNTSDGPTAGNYEASDDNSISNLDTFDSTTATSYDSSIPQVPGTINYGYNSANPSQTRGPITETFESNFNGAPANGTWALYTYQNDAVNETIAGGWCIALTLNTGVATTTTLTTTANPQVAKSDVTLTAAVKAGSSPVTSGGTVTFLENQTAPAGTSGGDNVVNLNTSNGEASFTTGSVSSSVLIGSKNEQDVYLTSYEGDYLMEGDYGGTESDNPSAGSLVQRFDDNTTFSAGSGSSINACNTGAVLLNQGNKGPFEPNPSNVFVANMPGTVKTVTLSLNGFFTYSDSIYQMQSLIKGPTGAALDFYSNTGNDQTVLGGSTSPWGNLTFADSAAAGTVPDSGNYAAGTYKPTAYEGSTSKDTFTSSTSGFYNVPSSFSYAQPHGSGTFANTFDSTNPNGTWSLFFNASSYDSGEGAQNGWCLNFTENPVTIDATESHSGTGTAGAFVQGEQNAEITTVVENTGAGSTGDPLGTNPLTVVDTLNSALTYESFSGTGWACTASDQKITCTNDSAVASGSSYPTLTLDVNVSSSAPGSISNSVTVSGAGVTTANPTDTIPVDANPLLAVSKSHTGNFTQGTTGVWTIVVSNTAANGATSGTVTMSDTLPTNYTLASYNSTSSLWTCNGSSNVVTCTATPGIAGGGSSTINLTVNVPTGSPTSVTNKALAWGGGDILHTSQATAAISNTDTVTVDQAPSITSANSTTFSVGSTGSFTVTASGYPTPTITETGGLPTGVTMNTHGVLSGKPAAGSGGTYLLTITAANGVSPNATQNFTLTVDQAPGIVSAASTTFTVGSAGSFFVIAGGNPPPTFTEVGNLPSGVTLSSGGVLSGTPAAGTGGQYPITITASNGVSPNATQNFTLTVHQAPTITSANNATFTTGTAGSFTVIAGGYPTPSISATGSLPSGVTMNTSGVLSGTPAAGTGGTYPLTITAANGISPNATQSFTLTVNQPPAITSATSTTFTAGSAGSFTVTATGNPAPTFSETGNLPSGVTLSSSGVLSGTPASGTGGIYPIIVTATNGVGSNATQNFTLTVNQAPAITSAPGTTFMAGATSSFTVMTVGYPTPAMSEAGSLPSGVTFVDNGNGTGTLAGTPAAGAGGAYAFTITAANGISPNATQNFTLNVVQPTAITSAASATFGVEVSSSFQVTATGYPVPTFIETGALPSGVTFSTSGLLSGTPAFGSQGSYPITITASNDVGSPANQSFTLTVTPPSYLVVNVATDDTGTAGNCSIQNQAGSNTTDGSCSLRDALLEAASLGAAAISFDHTAFGSAQTIALSNGTLNVPAYTSVAGPTSGSGASLSNLVTVSGGGATGSLPLFTITGTTTAIGNLKMSATSAAALNYGIQLNYADSLTLTNSSLAGTEAGGSSVGLAGIFNDYNASLTLIDSTVSGFSANGLINEAGSILTLTGSTITNNGGGISNGSGTLSINSSTISGNTSPDSGGGGISSSGGTVTLANSIVAGNSAPVGGYADIAGAYTDNGGNLASNNGSGTSTINPNLAPLANYGGPTQTMIPLPGSLAICDGVASNILAGVTTDERGYPNTNTSYPGYSTNTPCVDAGAVQTNYALAFTGSFLSTYPAGPPISPLVPVSLTESGSLAVVATNTVTMTDSDSELTGTDSEPLSSGVANFTNLILSTPESSDTLTATLPLAPSLSLTAQSPPFKVVLQSVPDLFSPAPGSVIGAGSVTFTWTPGVGVTAYELYVGTTGVGSGNLYSSGHITATSATAPSVPYGLATDTVYVRLWYEINGAWLSTDYTYSVTQSVAPVLTAPTPHTVLGTSNVTFTWTTGTGVNAYELYVGTNGVGSGNLYSSGNIKTTSATAPSVPYGVGTDTVYVRLWYEINGAWLSTDYTYSATQSVAPVLTTPTPGPGTQLGTGSVIFTWTPGTAATAYELYVGTTGVDSSNVYSSGHITATSATAPRVPYGVGTDTVYVRLWYEINGAWLSTDYTYSATQSVAPVLTTPTPNTILGTSSVTFTWTTGIGATVYELYVGTNGVGSGNLYSSGNITTTTATVPTLPANGATVYVRLWYEINGTWLSTDYTYTEQ